MDGKRLIEKITLRNILSFGDLGEEITLEPLNIIIGQNASGKSNLVDVIKLLRASTTSGGFSNQIVKGGGIGEWIWKGKKNDNMASISVSAGKLTYSEPNVTYNVIFEESYGGRFRIADEIITENGKQYYLRENLVGENENGEKKKLEKLSEQETIFSKMEAVDFFGSGWDLSENISEIKFFTELNTNRTTDIRKPQIPDSPNNFLEEDASNLALVLNDLEHRGNTKDKIVEYLKKFNPRIKDYSIRILGGTVQLFIREEGLEKPISAMRLSDGTLRYLCLLAILCHPEPPPLICIEEPETGLHPDILPTIAELMIEASQRTQLIVTTHSDILVSAFSENPEAVLVCEKDEDGTHFKRLEADKLKVWLEEYTLGEVWMRGGIGGTRW
ncbi:MAG: AAA family ATPase [Acidobacteriota bacterium]|nr:AAA family ATPase [Acidobacteriota bacterium]